MGGWGLTEFWNHYSVIFNELRFQTMHCSCKVLDVDQLSIAISLSIVN